MFKEREYPEKRATMSCVCVCARVSVCRWPHADAYDKQEPRSRMRALVSCLLGASPPL